MFKRIFLFIAVNALVMITISLLLSVLNIGPYMGQYGLNYGALLAFCAVWGFAGSLISLMLSRWMAKFMMGVQVIDPYAPRSSVERDLLQMVQRLAQKAALPGMPQVGIYASPEVNAFATGPSKGRALVAVSSGLLERMDGRAVEGVLSHEIAHISNGDMVTMTLIQGVVNTFTLFLSRVAAWAVSQALSSNRDRDEAPSSGVYFILTFVFDIIFTLFGSIVVAYFSRLREFRADKGGAQLAGREKMVHALSSLKRSFEVIDDSHPAVASLKISGRKSIWALFSTHPDLDDRIAALNQLA